MEGRSGWWKVKHRITTKAIVGGITGTISEPRSLVLGRYSADGMLRVVVRSTLLPSAARAALSRVFTIVGGDHPWPEVLPASWAGGVPVAGEPIQYTRVLPDVVAEISVDAAVEHGRWRHAVRFVRLRPDIRRTMCPCASIWNDPHIASVLHSLPVPSRPGLASASRV